MTQTNKDESFFIEVYPEQKTQSNDNSLKIKLKIINRYWHNYTRREPWMRNQLGYGKPLLPKKEVLEVMASEISILLLGLTQESISVELISYVLNNNETTIRQDIFDRKEIAIELDNLKPTWN